MRIFSAVAAAMASFFFCSPLQADPLTDDIHCYVITLQMIGSKNSAEQVVAVMAHAYWLGRIDGRAPDLDLEPRLMAELPAMNNPDFFKAEAVRCGEIMKARGQAETEMGNDMKKRGQKAMEEENSR